MAGPQLSAHVEGSGILLLSWGSQRTYFPSQFDRELYADQAYHPNPVVL
jgi:hypothetical protein